MLQSSYPVSITDQSATAPSRYSPATCSTSLGKPVRTLPAGPAEVSSLASPVIQPGYAPALELTGLRGSWMVSERGDDLMGVRLSILDLALVAKGQTASDSFRASVALAQKAEEVGYHRVWYAEHHNMPAIASSATSVLIAHVGAQTSSIRLGAGGVMLPNHSPLVIAEQFGTLAAMYPGRIDLGLGRAPGSDQQTTYALRRDPRTSERFPQDVLELQAFLRGESTVPGVDAYPGKGLDVPLYILGSSLFGAQLAGMLGLPYAFASHFAPDALMEAIANYKAEFKPSAQLGEPYVIAGVNVIAADTMQSAQEQFQAIRRTRAVSLFGRRLGLPQDLSDEQADELLASAVGMHVDQMLKYAAVGSPQEVRDYLDQFAKKTGADELITAHQAPSVDARLRSVELLAKAMAG
jgi:luciferase family oxidoreductase group 1